MNLQRVPRQWRSLDDPALGFANLFSDVIRLQEGRHPGLLPNLRLVPTFLIGSDYGGLHKSASYETYSLVLAGAETLGPWDERRSSIRDRARLGSRRLSYKALNDRKRLRALPAYLEAANLIPGLLVAILIDHRIQSIFEEQVKGRGSAKDVYFPGWRPRVIERALRVIHLVSLFLGGMSTPNQDVLWLTDEDDIAANEDRLRELVNAFAIVSSHYVGHALGHVKIGTTKSDTGRRDVEDFVAIADVTAGAIQEVIAEQGVPTGRLWLPPPRAVPAKARLVMDWLADNTQELKRLAYTIDEDPASRKLRITSFRFHGSRDLAV